MTIKPKFFSILQFMRTSLTDMPERYPTVEWEPWSSENMHKIPIRKFIVFYSVNIIEKTVTVVRILYSGRNTEDLIKNDR